MNNRYKMPLCRSPWLVLAGLLSLTLPHPVRGDNPQPLYRVELLLFRNLTPDPRSTELWPSRKPFPVPQNAIHLPLRVSQQTGSNPYHPENVASRNPAIMETPPGFQALSADALTMESLANKLRRSAHYRLLSHSGWQQRAPAERRARAVLLVPPGAASTSAPHATGADVAPLVEETAQEFIGTLTLYQTRVLRVEINVQVHDSSTPARYTEPPRQSTGIPSGNPYSTATFTPILEPKMYRMNETRGVRPGEIHYLDHPQFGVLLRVDQLPLHTDP